MARKRDRFLAISLGNTLTFILQHQFPTASTSGVVTVALDLPVPSPRAAL
jgi:hypothetical protein